MIIWLPFFYHNYRNYFSYFDHGCRMILVITAEFTLMEYKINEDVKGTEDKTYIEQFLFKIKAVGFKMLI